MDRRSTLIALALLVSMAVPFDVGAQAASAPKPRARDLGIPIEGIAGTLDAITDVAGVEVGHATLISGSGRCESGRGPFERASR